MPNTKNLEKQDIKYPYCNAKIPYMCKKDPRNPNTQNPWPVLVDDEL